MEVVPSRETQNIDNIDDINNRVLHSQSIEQPKVSRKRKFGALYPRVIEIDDLNSLQVDRMYQLFSQYYENHSKFQFLEDLFEKSKVIVLFDRKQNTIQGFSTLLEFRRESDGVSYTGVYSGDTVVSKDYWGSPQLGIAFLVYLWKLKVKNPFRPLYWFLISKGYKTYLLMANNFDLHYPRFEKGTDKFHRKIMAEFYFSKFPDSFDVDSMRIIPKESSCQLKPDVACIEEKFLKHPRIAFFKDMNPNWNRGEELCCVAKMTLLMPLKYSLKKVFKQIFKKQLR